MKCKRNEVFRKKCAKCGKGFYSNIKKSKYCSNKCQRVSCLTGSNGEKPWNIGLKGYMLGEKNGMWKGDKVSYVGLHQWVRRKLGRPKKCEHCGTTKAKMYNWANISKKYLRDIKDWKRLCRQCHHKYDNISESIRITKLKNRK